MTDKELFNYIESKTKETLEILTDLVKIPTQVPPGDNYDEIIEFLMPFFEELGFRVENLHLPEDVFKKKNPDLKDLCFGDRANLHAIKKVGADKTIVINAHLDVVPVTSNWSVPPFEGTIRNGRFYARGASDCKSAPAALITALTAIKELNLDLKYNLNIALTTDEEVGPYSGLCYFADKDLLKGDYFLSTDANGEDIIIGANGNINWQIEVYGKSWHSGTSFLGINAIEKSISIMNELMSLKYVVEQRRSIISSSKSISEKTGITKLKPVLNITMINAGVKENIIPSICTLKGDRRIIPEESSEDAILEIKNALERAKKSDPDLRFDYHFMETYPPLHTDLNHPWIKKVQETAMYVKGKNIELAGIHGSLDVAYAIQITKQPVCCYGIGRALESNVHGEDENIRINDLVNYTKFLGKLLCKDDHTL
ncbi:MAG: M20 family metallopeptidase [Methanosarcinales archaeon]